MAHASPSCPPALDTLPGVGALARSLPGDALPRAVTARVVERSELRRFGSASSFFSVCVRGVDDACEVRVVFWNGAAVRFSEVALNGVYVFSGGTLSKASTCYNPYARTRTHVWHVELHFNDHNLSSARVEPAPEHAPPAHRPVLAATHGLEAPLYREPKRRRTAGGHPDAEPGRRFTFVDLCCGIGGFHVAARACGGRCLLAVDLDAQAIKVYRSNFSHEMEHGTVVEGRIEDSGHWNLPQGVDLLFAGFPCQPFSGAGWQAGFQDMRGSVIFSIVKRMQEVRPRVALLENVGNFSSHDGGRTLERVIAVLAEVGYCAQWTRCDAASVLPQTRQRTYIAAVRRDVFARACEDGRAGQLPQLSRPSTAPSLRSRRVIERSLDPCLRQRLLLPPDVAAQYSPESYDAQSWPWRGYPRVLRADGRTPTLMRSYGTAHTIPASSRRHPQLHGFFWREGCGCAAAGCECSADGPGALRWLSPRECARLQGFPESFCLHEECEEAWRQLGNAVAPPVVAMLVEGLVSSYLEGGGSAEGAVRRMSDLLAESVPP